MGESISVSDFVAKLRSQVINGEEISPEAQEMLSNFLSKSVPSTQAPSDDTSKSPQKSQRGIEVESEGDEGDDEGTSKRAKGHKEGGRLVWTEASTLWLIDCVTRYPNAIEKTQIPKQAKDAWKSVLAEVNEKYTKTVSTTKQVKTKSGTPSRGSIEPLRWTSTPTRPRMLLELQGVHTFQRPFSYSAYSLFTSFILFEQLRRVKLTGSTLKYYTALHAILGKDQASAPAYLIDGDDIKTSDPLPQANSPTCATPATPVTPAGAAAAIATHTPVASAKPSSKEKAKAPREKSSARMLGNQARKLQQSHAAMRPLVKQMRESERRAREDRAAEIAASQARHAESMRLQAESQIEMTYTLCRAFGKKDIPMPHHMVLRLQQAATDAAKAEAQAVVPTATHPAHMQREPVQPEQAEQPEVGEAQQVEKEAPNTRPSPVPFPKLPL
ncbi:hypothetical protein CYMTET_29198, partial [Cymbomonas tetramitiformis]